MAEMPKYENLLEFLARQCLEDSERWFGDAPKKVHYSLSFLTLCLSGEVGEAANVIKKVERGSVTFVEEVKEAYTMEIVDAFVYLLNIAGVLGIDLEEKYYEKRAFNEERFMQQREWREKARVARQH